MTKKDFPIKKFLLIITISLIFGYGLHSNVVYASALDIEEAPINDERPIDHFKLNQSIEKNNTRISKKELIQRIEKENLNLSKDNKRKKKDIFILFFDSSSIKDEFLKNAAKYNISFLNKYEHYIKINTSMQHVTDLALNTHEISDIRAVINPKLEAKLSDTNNPHMVFLQFSHDLTESEKDMLVSLGVNIDRIYPTKSARVFAPENAIDELAQLDFVIRINDAEVPVERHLSYAIPMTTVDEVKDWYQNKYGSALDGSGVRVAVIDTGYDESNPYLKAPVVKHHYKFGLDDEDITDNVGHGTHVAGIIVSTHSTYEGVATGADLIFLKYADCGNPYGCAGYIADAIYDAVDIWNTDIISLSVGPASASLDGTSDWARAVDYASRQGATVFVAAGNDGWSKDTITSPADAKNAITLGATSHWGSLSKIASGDRDIVTWYSSRGDTTDGRDKPDIVAPGGDCEDVWCSTGYKVGMISTRASGTGNDIDAVSPTQYFIKKAGTSMATPFGAGVGALYLDHYSSVFGTSSTRAAKLKSTLMASAINVDAYSDTSDDGSWSDEKGLGKIDMTNGFLSWSPNKEGTFFQGSVGGNEADIFTEDVPSGASIFRVVAAWSDPVSTSTSGCWGSLQNDIDLELVSPSGTHYYSSSCANPVEHITVNNPNGGTWTIKIKGYGSHFASSSQDYGGFWYWAKSNPSLSLSLSSSKSNVNIGDTFNVTATVYNQGDVTASGVDAQLSYDTNIFNLISGDQNPLLGSVGGNWENRSYTWEFQTKSDAPEGASQISVTIEDSTETYSSSNSLTITVVDSSPPSNPTDVWSTSHSTSTWSNDYTIDVSWSGASDSGSGVAGYYYKWDTSSSTIPTSSDSYTTGTSVTSSSLSTGNSWYFHVRTKDNAGNLATDAKHLGPFYIDASPPGNPSPDDGVSGWTANNDPTFSWSAVSDTGSGVDGYYYELDDSTPDYWTTGTSISNTNIPDGTHTFYVRAKDNAGNLGGVGSHEIKIDTEAPTLGTPEIYSGNVYGSYYSGLSVDIRATASDTLSGLNTGTCEYSIDNGANWYSAGWDGTYCYKTGVSASGTVNVKFRIKDNANNQGASPTETYYQDNSPPSVSVSGVPASWQNSDASASVSCSDGGSGCSSATHRLKIYSSNPGSCPTNYADYGLSTPQTISSHKWTCAAAKDNLGNIGYSTPVEFKIDKALPTITDDYAYDGVWVSTDQIVTLSPADSGGSGIKEVKYCAGSSCTPDTILASPYQLSYTADQDTIVRYQTWDNGGNPSAVGEYNVKLDKTAPPTPGPDANPSGWTNDATPNIYGYAVTDAGSGVNRYEYQIDSTSGTWTSIGLASSFDVPSQADGVHVVYVRAADNVGFNSSPGSVDIYVDTGNPGSPSPSGPSGWTNDSTPSITWSAVSDSPSGVAGYEYAIDQTTTWTNLSNVLSFDTPTLSDGEHTVHVRAYDKAGNRGTQGSTTVHIDTAAPTTTISPGSSEAWHTTAQTVTLTVGSDISGIAGTYYKIDDGTRQPYISPFTALEGNHNYTYWSVDNASNVEAAKTAIIKVDTIDPTIDITSPTTAAFVFAKPSGTVKVNYSYTEANPASVAIEVSKGSTVIGTKTVTTLSGGNNVSRSDSVSLSDTATDGDYDLRVMLSDLAGNTPSTDTETNAVKVDSTAPTISSVSLDKTMVKSGTSIAVNVSASDDNGLASVTADGDALSLSGGAWSGGISAVNSEGNHTVTVIATDNAGNQKTDTSKSYTVDNTSPSVIITAPTNESVLKGTVSIEGSVTDTYLQSTSVRIDDTEVSTTLPYSWDTTSATETAHTISARGTDGAGNTNTTEITVRVDNTAPEIRVTSPTTRASTYGSQGKSVDISYVYTEENPGSVAIDIHEGTTNIGTANITGLAGGTNVSRTDPVTLNDTVQSGKYDVRVNITDRVGKAAGSSEADAVMIDNMPPEQVGINSPVNGSLHRGVVEVNASAGDALSGIARVEFFAGNSSIGNDTVSPYSYSWDTTVMGDGSYLLYARAYDGAKNANTSVPVLVDVDNTPPGVTNLPSPSVIGANDIVKVTADVADANLDTVLAEVEYPDGSVLTREMKNGSRYHLEIADTMQYGEYTVTVIANDTLGNVNDTEKFSFTVQKPDLKIGSIHPDVAYPEENSTVEIDVTVDNLGATDAGNFKVSFYDGQVSPANLIGSETISVSGNSQSDASIMWRAAPFGVHTINVRVDPEGGIAESNESNNMASVQIDVIKTFSGATTISNGTSGQVIASPGELEIEATANENASASVNISATLSRTSGTFGLMEINPSNSDADEGMEYLELASLTDLGDISKLRIKVYYDTSEANSLMLALYYWNGSWVKCEDYINKTIQNGPHVYGAGRDTGNNYVWAEVDHFSYYAVGGVTDSDGDGIPDTGDACPNEAENFNSYEDSDGCPDSKPAPAGGGGGGIADGPSLGVISEDFTDLNMSIFEKILDTENLLYRDYVEVPRQALASLLSIAEKSRNYPFFQDLEEINKTEPEGVEGDIYEVTAERVMEEYGWPRTIILARGDLEVDSYAAMALSKDKRAPLLLTKPEELPQPTLGAIDKLKPREIIIVGGPEAVSEGVEEKLKEKAEVTRYWGATRVETAVEIAREFDEPDYITVASWDSDEKAAYISYLYESPLLYIKNGKVPDSVRSYLTKKLDGSQKPKIIFVDIDEDVREEIKDL